MIINFSFKKIFFFFYDVSQALCAKLWEFMSNKIIDFVLLSKLILWFKQLLPCKGLCVQIWFWIMALLETFVIWRRHVSVGGSYSIWSLLLIAVLGTCPFLFLPLLPRKYEVNRFLHCALFMMRYAIMDTTMAKFPRIETCEIVILSHLINCLSYVCILIMKSY